MQWTMLRMDSKHMNKYLLQLQCIVLFWPLLERIILLNSKTQKPVSQPSLLL